MVIAHLPVKASKTFSRSLRTSIQTCADKSSARSGRRQATGHTVDMERKMSAKKITLTALNGDGVSFFDRDLSGATSCDNGPTLIELHGCEEIVVMESMSDILNKL